MTDADRIAQLEAELEVARREWDNERSTREALDRDVARLKRQVGDLLSVIRSARAVLDLRDPPEPLPFDTQPTLKRLAVESGADGWQADMVLGASPEAREAFACTVAAILDSEPRAVNYLEMQVVHPDGRAYAVTCQRVEGKTPAQKATEAERDRDALAEALGDAVELIRELKAYAVEHWDWKYGEEWTEAEVGIARALASTRRGTP